MSADRASYLLGFPAEHLGKLAGKCGDGQPLACRLGTCEPPLGQGRGGRGREGDCPGTRPVAAPVMVEPGPRIDREPSIAACGHERFRRAEPVPTGSQRLHHAVRHDAVVLARLFDAQQPVGGTLKMTDPCPHHAQRVGVRYRCSGHRIQPEDRIGRRRVAGWRRVQQPEAGGDAGRAKAGQDRQVHGGCPASVHRHTGSGIQKHGQLERMADVEGADAFLAQAGGAQHDLSLRIGPERAVEGGVEHDLLAVGDHAQVRALERGQKPGVQVLGKHRCSLPRPLAAVGATITAVVDEAKLADHPVVEEPSYARPGVVVVACRPLRCQSGHTNHHLAWHWIS